MAVVSDYTALLSGSTWTGGVAGQAIQLTYSFSTSASSYLAADPSTAAAAATFNPLTASERTTVRGALAQWAAVSGITLHEVTATPGDLTFGFYDLSTLGGSGDAGLGNYPSPGVYLDASGKPQIYGNFDPSGGDVLFDDSYHNNPADAVDFAHVAIHEIGHALGLKHPFDTPGNTLTPALDNGSETVMAYAGIRSPTLEPLDIGAIQYLYGTPTTATHPFSTSWNASTESLTDVGTATAHDMFGSGGDDVFISTGARDAISGGEGDDIVYATGAPISVNGGPGTDTVVTGLTYSGSTQVGGTGGFRYIYLAAYGDFQTYQDVERLDFTNGVYSTATNSFSAYQPGTYVWTGDVDGGWGTAGNWKAVSGGSAAYGPGAADTVALTGVAVSGGGAALRLSLAGAVTLAGSYSIGSLVGGSGATVVAAGGRLGVSGAGTLAGGSLVLSGGSVGEFGGHSIGLPLLPGSTFAVDGGDSFTGFGTVTAAVVVNSGRIEASGGTLRLNGSAAPGLGSAYQIDAGATLSVQLLSGVSTFQAGGGTLLADTAPVGGALAVVAGFAAGDTIGLGGVAASSASYVATGANLGTLSVGGYAVQLAGDYSQMQFKAVAGGGGTTITVGPKAVTDPLFDAGYYLAHNPDVAAAGVDPLLHYENYGWKEGRNPSALFDDNYYLAQNPDVKAAGVDPLLHYEYYGWKEGRDPSLLFSDSKYFATYADVAAAYVNPLAHYMVYGQHEGRASFLTGGSAAADPLVNAAYYDTQLGATLIPGGIAGAQQAAAGYASSGWMKGLNPDAFFDTKYYLSQNPDVAAAYVNPLLHYETYGWKEGRNPSAAFNTNKYLATYADVKAAGVDPLAHYVMYGQAEGRTL